MNERHVTTPQKKARYEPLDVKCGEWPCGRRATYEVRTERDSSAGKFCKQHARELVNKLNH